MFVWLVIQFVIVGFADVAVVLFDVVVCYCLLGVWICVLLLACVECCCLNSVVGCLSLTYALLCVCRLVAIWFSFWWLFVVFAVALLLVMWLVGEFLDCFVRIVGMVVLFDLQFVCWAVWFGNLCYVPAVCWLILCLGAYGLLSSLCCGCC